MNIYEGHPERIGGGGFKVTKNGETLSPARSQRVFNHSPNGFNWGYEGSGPAQLALALLLEETDKTTAVDLHQQFKRESISLLRKHTFWRISSAEIKSWLREARRKEQYAQSNLP